MSVISEKQAKIALEGNYKQAEEMLKDKDKIEAFLQDVEKFLASIPQVGDALSDVPVLISLVRSYIKKEYTDIPLLSIILIVSALIYILSPIDIIPDTIPVVGFLDDAAVIAILSKWLDNQIDDYRAWRVANGRQ